MEKERQTERDKEMEKERLRESVQESEREKEREERLRERVQESERETNRETKMMGVTNFCYKNGQKAKYTFSFEGRGCVFAAIKSSDETCHFIAIPFPFVCLKAP